MKTECRIKNQSKIGRLKRKLHSTYEQTRLMFTRQTIRVTMKKYKWWHTKEVGSGWHSIERKESLQYSVISRMRGQIVDELYYRSWINIEFYFTQTLNRLRHSNIRQDSLSLATNAGVKWNNHEAISTRFRKVTDKETVSLVIKIPRKKHHTSPMIR
jgi:hypothetical protein